MKNRKPNIVFVLTDDQGYGDLGCTGNPWIQTPNIDEFYGDSVRMTNYHVGTTCAPTRSGLMTGHYANSTGVWHTIGGRSLLRADEWSLATALSENGYETGIFGKWHLGDSYPYRPEDRGFSEVVVHGGGGISQTPDYWGNDYFDDTYRVNGEYQQFKGYCTDVFFDEAKKFIRKNKENPFFCYIATNAPHAPYNVETKYADLYRGKVMERRARFYGMITNIDENFGKLRQLLKEEGLEENTILIFMTDNGSSCAISCDEQGNIIEGYNAGLRGTKGSPYDGGHRVPFFIRYPNGEIVGGKDYNELTAYVDFMPTLLDFCDISYAEDAFHGISLKKAMEDTDTKLPARFVVTDTQRVPNPIKWKGSAVMQGEMRLVNSSQLYDMTVDRMQQKDISAENPRLVAEMKKAYEEWWNLVSVKFDDPIPLYVTKKTRLTAHDWRGDVDNCVWHQRLVRNGQKTSGHWEIYAEKDGTYKVQAYRWAPETGYTLSQGIEGNDSGYDRIFVDETAWLDYEGGVSICIKTAEIIIDGKKIMTVDNVDGDKTYVEFLVNIEAGNHTMEVVFTDDEGNEFGAYYAEVECC